MRRTTLLLLTMIAAVLVAASGVALAKVYVGTYKGETILGTEHADNINARGGDDVVFLLASTQATRREE